MSNFLKLVQEATPGKQNSKKPEGFFKRVAKGIESIEKIGTGKWYNKGSASKKIKPTQPKPVQPEKDFKVGDLVMVNTKKGGKKQAIIRQIRPDKTVQLALRNGPTYVTSAADIIGKVETL